jgi:uncharacterized protein YeaO (DUF488 family)
VLTSYFAKSKKIDSTGYKPVSIARTNPSWYEGEVYKTIAPTSSLLYDYKQGNLTEEEYTTRYKEEVLDRLDPKAVFDELGEDAILLCYEKSEDFCHRQLVSAWLTKAGYRVLEYKENNSTISLEAYI